MRVRIGRTVWTGSMVALLTACCAEKVDEAAAPAGVAPVGMDDRSSHVGVPDPRDILRDAIVAAGQVHTLQYDAVEEKSIGNKHEITSATIAMSRLQGDPPAPTRDMLRAKWFVQGEHVIIGAQTFPIHAVYDGKGVTAIDDKNERILEADATDVIWGTLSRPCNRLIFRQYLRADAWLLELKSPTVEYQGTADINGVHCDVVYVHYGRGTRRAHWYFGVEDHLPHGVTFRSNMSDGTDITLARTMKNMVVNEPIDDALFVIDNPRDYPVVAYELPKRAPAQPLLAVGDAAPNWTLKAANGESMSLESLAGKVVVMDFWATWCGPCKRAMPGMQKLHDDYAGKGVIVIGISCKEKAGADPAGYMEEQGYTYQLLVDGNEVADAYKVRGIPTFYVVGQDGNILLSKVGATPANHEAMIETINAAIDGEAEAGS